MLNKKDVIEAIKETVPGMIKEEVDRAIADISESVIKQTENLATKDDVKGLENRLNNVEHRLDNVERTLTDIKRDTSDLKRDTIPVLEFQQLSRRVDKLEKTYV